jgi:ribosomal protein S18 acetylase RimI-like enzyme
MSKGSREAFEIVDVNEANIGDYGLLCMQSKKNTDGYRCKLEWTKERFKEGLRVKLLLVDEGAKRGLRARGFIEYIPGKYTWRGIDADGYMVIHCIWVVGHHKGHGYGSKLLEHCLNDAKRMNGVAVMTGKTWLPGAKLFMRHGFEKVDSAPPDFELFAKRFSEKAPMPRFRAVPKEELEKYGSGITVFKSSQCPYVSGAVKEMMQTAKRINLPIRVIDIKTCTDAQNNVHPYGTFCVIQNGRIMTYRPIGAKGLLKYLAKKE